MICPLETEREIRRKNRWEILLIKVYYNECCTFYNNCNLNEGTIFVRDKEYISYYRGKRLE